MSPGGSPGAEARAGFGIDRDGVWHHDGQEVTHPGVLRSLYAALAVDADGHHLRAGPTRIPVAVEDAPFVVIRVTALVGSGGPEVALRAWLSDGTVEDLWPEALWLGSRGIPYCRVKGGRFVARLALPAWLQVAAFAEDAAGGPVLVLGGRRHPMVRGGGLAGGPGGTGWPPRAGRG